MTSETQHQPGNPVAARARHGFAADLLGEVVPARLRAEPPALPADADLGNVVLLFRQHRSPGENANASLSATRADRTAGSAHAADRWIVAFLAGSLAVHLGIASWFNQPPPPLASIGVISMTAEIVLGADVAAGFAKTPSPSEAAASSVPSPEQSEQMARYDLTRAEIKPTVEPQIAERRAVREAPPPPPDALLPEPAETAVPPSDIPTPAPVEVAELPPPSKPVETKVEQPPEPPAAKPPEPEAAMPVEKPPQAATPEQPKREAQRRAKDKGKRKTAAVASTTSSGVGRGRSDASTNYRGLVAAHLARHKQYPADARSRGEEGSAMVSFSIDASGRVTRVALSRHAGVASLDQESLAMVRRASPFPAPPEGQPMSFTVPVSFALR